MKNNLSIIMLAKRTGDFVIKDLWTPLSRFVKYPVLFTALLTRIHKLGAEYNIQLNIQTYRMNTLGIAKAKQELKNLGGIYIWYCHVTGFFYLGSAQEFFGRGGRLSSYLMPSRLAASGYLSPDIAKAINTYGHDAFSLIIVESFPVSNIVQAKLFTQEQLWMLLYPTYNRSLTVGSNSGVSMLEQDRVAMSTTVYQYEADTNGLISGSEQVHLGIKHLTRTGFSSIFSPTRIIPISYFDLSVLLETKILYKNRFLFTTTRLEENDIVNWKRPFSTVITNSTQNDDGRTSGVWVYKAFESNHLYTKRDLIKYYPTVTECREAYDISKTHFQRLRRYRSVHHGVLFSNTKLHV